MLRWLLVVHLSMGLNYNIDSTPRTDDAHTIVHARSELSALGGHQVGRWNSEITRAAAELLSTRRPNPPELEAEFVINPTSPEQQISAELGAGGRAMLQEALGRARERRRDEALQWEGIRGHRGGGGTIHTAIADTVDLGRLCLVLSYPEGDECGRCRRVDSTICCHQFAHTATASGNVTAMEWCELNGVAGLWELRHLFNPGRVQTNAKVL